METDQLGRLRDIREAARLITSYVAGTTELAFRALSGVTRPWKPEMEVGMLPARNFVVMGATAE